MATSIRELIVDNIESVLAALIPTTPTSSDIRKVSRAQLPAKIQTVRPAVILWSGTERKNQDTEGATRCELDVHVHLLGSCNSDVETEAAAWINTIVTAILTDRSRGGRAVDTLEVENEIYAADLAKPEYTVAMTFLVRYLHQHGNPDTAP